MRSVAVVAVAALAITGLAQSGLAQSAPKAQVFAGHDVGSQMAALVQSAQSSGSSGATLGDYRSHAIKLSARIASGGAEVHAHCDDIFVVTEGRATLVTGGSVTNARTGDDGETTGSSIQNGQSRVIEKTDIVHIPAGTPHQLLIAPGTTFSSIVVKVKE